MRLTAPASSTSAGSSATWRKPSRPCEGTKEDVDHEDDRCKLLTCSTPRRTSSIATSTKGVARPSPSSARTGACRTRVLYEQVNRTGSALRNELGVRPEERVLLLMLDGPEMVFAFFGAIKIGAVPIPTNTLWTPADYEFVLRDSRAAWPSSAPRCIRGSPTSSRDAPRCGTSSLSAGRGDGRALDFDALIGRASPAAGRPSPRAGMRRRSGCIRRAAPVGRKAASTCSTTWWSAPRPTRAASSGLRPTDRCFSVAKLFFAYGLGNAMYFPLAVGATSILWPGPVTPPVVYDIIERYRPTLFFSVPTHYAMLLAHRDETREFDLSSIRCAVSAGESLPPAVLTRFRERFGVEILDGIGSTEVLHIFISNRRGSVRAGLERRSCPRIRGKTRRRERRPGRDRRDRQSADQGRLDVRLLLEPA